MHWHDESYNQDYNGWRGRGLAGQYHPISVSTYWHSSKDTHSCFWSNWHLQSWFWWDWSSWNVPMSFPLYNLNHQRYAYMIFTPLNTKSLSKKHILLFVSITFLSHEIWGKRFEWFSWFCFIFLPLPVISGDETLQQSSHQILVWTLEFLKILSSDIFEVSDGKMRKDCKVYVVQCGGGRGINSLAVKS